LEEFEENYGSLIRQKQEISENSTIPSKERQIEQNKDFARECQDKGCDGQGLGNASKEVNDKTYTYTPKGKPED
jgi:hypothetical protein